MTEPQQLTFEHTIVFISGWNTLCSASRSLYKEEKWFSIKYQNSALYNIIGQIRGGTLGSFIGHCFRYQLFQSTNDKNLLFFSDHSIECVVIGFVSPHAFSLNADRPFVSGRVRSFLSQTSCCGGGVFFSWMVVQWIYFIVACTPRPLQDTDPYSTRVWLTDDDRRDLGLITFKQIFTAVTKLSSQRFIFRNDYATECLSWLCGWYMKQKNRLEYKWITSKVFEVEKRNFKHKRLTKLWNRNKVLKQFPSRIISWHCHRKLWFQRDHVAGLTGGWDVKKY